MTAPGGVRVLFANPGADMYGSDRMALEAVRGLLSSGHRVLFTSSTDGPLTEAVRETGVQVRIVPPLVLRREMVSPTGFLAFLISAVRDLPRMNELVRRSKPDVVFANTVSLPFWSIVARLNRIPSIVYVHEAEASMNALAHRLLLLPLNLASGVIYNSATSRLVSGVPRLEKRQQTRVVHNGVLGPPSVTPPREKIDSPLRVAYLGRLSPRKGVDLLVDAVALLREKGTNVEAEIVGDVFPGYEWYEDDLRDQIHALELYDRVRLSGFLADVWPALARADVLVVPSRLDESFGNVVIEGALSARPVLAANHSGLREAARGLASATLIPNDDSAAIAAGLESVRDDWEGLRVAALRDAEFAAERYSPSSFRRRLVGAFLTLAHMG